MIRNWQAAGQHLQQPLTDGCAVAPILPRPYQLDLVPSRTQALDEAGGGQRYAIDMRGISLGDYRQAQPAARARQLLEKKIGRLVHGVVSCPERATVA